MKCHAGVEFPDGKPCPRCHAKLGEVCWPGINADLLELPRVRKEKEEAYGYAMRLAQSLYERLWKDQAPHWKPLPDLIGVLTQIDNMTGGLVRSPLHGDPSVSRPERGRD